MNRKDIRLSEIGHSEKDKYSYEILRVVKFIEAESRMVVARGGWEGGMGSYCLMGTEFDKMNRVMEMDIGDGCKTM